MWQFQKQMGSDVVGQSNQFSLYRYIKQQISVIIMHRLLCAASFGLASMSEAVVVVFVVVESMLACRNNNINNNISPARTS